MSGLMQRGRCVLTSRTAQFIISLLGLFLLSGVMVSLSAREAHSKPLTSHVTGKQGGQNSPAGARIALVIGNGKYGAAPLPGAGKNAEAIAVSLQRLGFEVNLATNLDAAQLKKRIAVFRKRLQHGGVGFFYFAGHIAQQNGSNYLLPVDVSSSRDIRQSGVEVNRVLTNLELAKSSAGIVVLDASRPHPYAKVPGLADMPLRRNSLIVSAAPPGRTVGGTVDGNAFVEEVSAVLESPDLNLSLAFRQAQEALRKRTAGVQDLWMAAALETDFPLNKRPRTGLEMVDIPGGCFQMGDIFGEGANDETPVHEVCVSDFTIGKYEVTQLLWRQIMGDNPSHFSRCGDECPVENVSWFGVQEFIRKLNEKNGSKFRLPTEAEWEYVARSGGKREKFSGGEAIDPVGWFSGNSGGTAHPVGQKQPNGLGVHDMTGNVWEWVEDWQDDYPASRQQDPLGPAGGTSRVARGGCWGGGPQYVRTTARFGSMPGGRNGFLGFRLAGPRNR